MLLVGTTTLPPDPLVRPLPGRPEAVEAMVEVVAVVVDLLHGVPVAKVATAMAAVVELVLGLVVEEEAEVDTAMTPMVAEAAAEEATTLAVVALLHGNLVVAVAPQVVLLRGPLAVVVAAPAAQLHGNKTTVTVASNSNTAVMDTIKAPMVNKVATARVVMDRVATMLVARVATVDRAVVAILGAVLLRLLLLLVAICLLHLHRRATMSHLHLRLVVECVEGVSTFGAVLTEKRRYEVMV